MNFDTCPRCKGGLEPSPTAPSLGDWWCPRCEGFVRGFECVVCGVLFPELLHGKRAEPWSNHNCDPRRVAQIEDARRAFSDEPRERTPRLAERLRDGFAAMGDDDPGE